MGLGADSVQTSNIRDHSRSDQHAHAMLLLRKNQAQARGLDASAYAPIAKALHQMSEGDGKPLGSSLISLILLLYNDWPSLTTPLCQLETKHGVDVGTAYRNQNAGKHSVTSLRSQGDNSWLKN